MANALPNVTWKQSEKFNLFYLDSTAGLRLSAPGQSVTGLSLRDTGDFCLEYDPDAGIGWLSFSESYRDNPGGKADTSGTVEVWLENYRVPVVKALNISASAVKPKLSLSAASSVINTALNARDLSTTVEVWNQAEGTCLDLTEAEVTYTGEFVRVSVSGQELTMTLTGQTGGTVSLFIRDSRWAQSIKLTHKISLETKLPVMKPASTLQLNRYFTLQTAATAVSLSQSNLTLSGIEFTPAAKDGTALRQESDKLRLYYSDGAIHGEIADPENAPKAGTYSFLCRGVLADGTVLAPVTVKVSVSGTLPKVKLSASTLQLNRWLEGEETVSTGTVITGGEGCILQGFAEVYEELSFRDGILSAHLTGSTPDGKVSFRLTPIFLQEETGQTVTLPTSLTLTLQVYQSDKLGVTLSAQGKLDTLNPDSAVTYTLSKLTNCSGIPEAVSPEGPDADKFHAELDTSGVKPLVKLTMREGQTYATNVTYKVQLRFRICGRDVLSAVQSVKVTQSALKLTAPKTVSLYQAQTAPLQAAVTLTAPAGARIGTITLAEKNAPEILAAFGDGGFSARIEGSTAVLSLDPTGAAGLKAGKSYTLLLDVTCANHAVNLKPTQLKLTVKILK